MLFKNRLIENAVLVVYFLVIIALPAIATVYGVFLFIQGQVTWIHFLILFIMHGLTGLGITIGFHRMLVHKGFKTFQPIRAILLTLACIALEGPPSTWASIHTKHHAFSDQPEDPHSPKFKGFFHAHIGWMFTLRFHEIDEIKNRYGKRFTNDSLVRFFDRTFLIWPILMAIILYFFAGWPGVLWGGWIRMFTFLQSTYCVNSVCHMFGSRDYETSDTSRNNAIVAILTLGEGWHNNHHAFPQSVDHGLKWWQLDISKYVIFILEKLGLIWDVKRAP